MDNSDQARPEDAGASPGPGPSAFWHLGSHLRLWPVAIVGLAFDLWSKDWAFRNVTAEGRTVIPKILSFELSLNSGALFGLGRGMSPLFVAASVLALLFVVYLFSQSSRDRWSLHVALGLILGGALGNLYDRSAAHADVVFGPPAGGFWQRLLGDHPMHTGILVDETETAWIFGRFPDEQEPRGIAKRDGLRLVEDMPVVRDFIKIDASLFGRDIWKWIFNVADVLLVMGVGLLLVNFRQERRALRAARPVSADAIAAPDLSRPSDPT